MNIVITIPNYIRQFRVSSKQRPTYWRYNQGVIRETGRGGRLLPKGFASPKEKIVGGIVFPTQLRSEYHLGKFNKENKFQVRVNFEGLLTIPPMIDSSTELIYLIDKNNEPILANPNKANLPDLITIKGQDIYSGDNEFIRGKAMSSIKDSFRPFVEHLPPFEKEMYPINIEVELHDTIKNHLDNSSGDGNKWDISNRAFPYTKAFCDLLVEMKILKDDDIMCVTKPPEAIFVPIENTADRKLVFRISKDEREVITNNLIYQNYDYND